MGIIVEPQPGTGELTRNNIPFVPIICSVPRRSCYHCGYERYQVRILNGYRDEPGEPRYLSVCAPGKGCRLHESCGWELVGRPRTCGPECPCSCH